MTWGTLFEQRFWGEEVLKEDTVDPARRQELLWDLFSSREDLWDLSESLGRKCALWVMSSARMKQRTPPHT